ncbi:MAG TPA: class I SAM-dependent methyltransferase [Anaerolineales bacterium]|nr:class I SAM-dependent methyltransferase [Anaerolineales bacterium]
MDIRSIIHRKLDPARIKGFGKIPWSDPDLSRRMLSEHLSQYNDAASRRKSLIRKHVNWIHALVLDKKPARILDLGCGPGLYSLRLAKMGHTCVGIDFAPAAIEYARAEAARVNTNCTFLLDDFIKADYGVSYDLVMMVFSELNTFDSTEIKNILEKSYKALAKGGKLLIEAPSFDAVYQIGSQPPIWYSEEKGVFSEEPYICLTESFWDEETLAAVERYYVIPGSGNTIVEYINRTSAFEESDYKKMMVDAGFNLVRFYPSLTGEKTQQLDGMFVILAEKA